MEVIFEEGAPRLKGKYLGIKKCPFLKFSSQLQNDINHYAEGVNAQIHRIVGREGGGAERGC